MARALKSARRPAKLKQNTASQFRNILHYARSFVSVGQTFIRGDNATQVTNHIISVTIDLHKRESYHKQSRYFPKTSILSLQK